MTSKYLETLTDLFSETSPSKEKVMGLMDETMKFFQDIKKKMTSTDPDDRREALEETLEMQKILKSKMEELTKKTGLDVSALASLADNPNMMRPDEKEIYEAAKERLNLLKEDPTSHKSKNLKTQIKG